MKRHAEVENRIFTLCIFILLPLLYLAILLSLFTGEAGKISFIHIGGLSVPSAVLFAVICGLAAWRRYFYFLFLIFVILAFPAPVDDFFPSVSLTTQQDKQQVVFPLITRIDIYLILGILLKLIDRSFRMPAVALSLWLKAAIIGYTLVLIINALSASDLWDLTLILSYSFHIRYALLAVLLISLYDISAYQKPLISGILLSLAFLLLESMINTLTLGSDRLVSGSLSLNTFANITAGLALFYIFMLRNRLASIWAGFIALGICAAIILGSGTRGAILTLFASWLLVYLFTNYRKLAFNLMKGIFGVLILLVVYLGANEKGLIPERYSYEYLSKRIKIDLGEDRLSKIVEIQFSRETSSIKSRLDLFDASINMIQQHPFAGIGSGRWNRYKNQYSENNNIPNVLLDTHNDYLALMSQYGIILGLLLAWGVFFRPFSIFRKMLSNSNFQGNPLLLLFVINFSMGIAGLSNAGFFKHQIAAFLFFNLSVLEKYYSKYKHENRTSTD